MGGSVRWKLIAERGCARNEPLLQRAEANPVPSTPAVPSAPSLPVNSVWKTIQSYILWQHERGTLHYDIMVTLILLFIFFSPRLIEFNDKPIPRYSHPTDVVVTTDGNGHLIYQVSASAIASGDDHAVREQLLHVIEPISGAVSIASYEPVYDHKGNLQGYKVVVTRE